MGGDIRTFMANMDSKAPRPMGELRHLEVSLVATRLQAWEHLQEWVRYTYMIQRNVAEVFLAAPGTGPPPGMQTKDQQPGRPGGFPSNFQPPANMPNINFNAPVIRLGTTGPPKPATPLGGEPGRRESEARPTRPGLGAGQGMDAQRQSIRESMMQLVPPTKEEIVRTIYVGGITEGSGGDEGMERILRSAGNLRRWIRAMDADNKACRFGFAEYEDPESLSTAVEVLKDVEVPIKSQTVNGINKEEASQDYKEDKSKLLVRSVDCRESKTKADSCTRSRLMILRILISRIGRLQEGTRIQ